MWNPETVSCCILKRWKTLSFGTLQSRRFLVDHDLFLSDETATNFCVLQFFCMVLVISVLIIKPRLRPLELRNVDAWILQTLEPCQSRSWTLQPCPVRFQRCKIVILESGTSEFWNLGRLQPWNLGRPEKLQSWKPACNLGTCVWVANVC